MSDGASTVDAGNGGDQQQQQPGGEGGDKSVLGREQQQQQQQQQQQPDPSAPPAWLAGLTKDELKGEKSLANFKSVDDLAEGYLETKRLASSKVTLPKADDPESFARFAAAVRPEGADKYTIEVPEGQNGDFAEAMRPVFFEAGLLPQQVDALVKANNAFQAEAHAAIEQKGADEIAALEAEMGKEDFARGKQAAIQMLNRLGVEISFENDLARMVGTGNTLRTLFALAEKTGELGRVHGDDVALALGNLTGEKALAAAQAMVRDSAIRPKLTDPTSPERKRYDQLVKAAAQG